MKYDKEFFGRVWQSRDRRNLDAVKFKVNCLTLPASAYGHGLWPSQVLRFCKPVILHSKLQEIQEYAMPKTLQ